MNIRSFKKRLAAKLGAEDGTVSVEAVLVFPLLIWALTATVVFFDAFKTLHLCQNASYAVADMLSRESVAIDDDYLTAMHEVFAHLAKGDGGTSSLRVTVVHRGLDADGNDEGVTLFWSEGVNGAQRYANLNVLEDRIPTMQIGDYLVVVETEHEWAPAFAVGLASYRFREVGISRTRFATRLCYDDGTGSNCGPDGTGAMTAPGSDDGEFGGDDTT